MNILITGVAGLIGSRLADYIIKNHPEATVFGIDDLSGGYVENVPKDVYLHCRNLVEEDISDCFEENQIDYVYHFAAYAAEGLSPFIRSYNYQNNLIATTKVVNECIKHDVKRLVFTSSMAVYGHNYGEMFDEYQTPDPIDPYGIAKYACEMDIQVAGEQHGLDWCIIRPHNVYGINQNIWDRYRNVLGIWMYQHLIGKPMTIFGDGRQKRAFSYIDDCLEGLWKSSQLDICSKEIINLGGKTPYTINEANQTLKEVINGGETVHLEGRHEVRNAYPTWEKSVELLGYRDVTPLHEGLKNMWEWAQKQPMRPVKHQKYEIEKGIYSFWK